VQNRKARRMPGFLYFLFQYIKLRRGFHHLKATSKGNPVSCL